jgi:hypothetical protein
MIFVMRESRRKNKKELPRGMKRVLDRGDLYISNPYLTRLVTYRTLALIGNPPVTHVLHTLSTRGAQSVCRKWLPPLGMFGERAMSVEELKEKFTPGRDICEACMKELD